MMSKAIFRVSHPIMTRRSMEKNHAIIGRIMEDERFDDIDEANQFLQKILVGGKVPDLLPRTPAEEAQYLVYDAWGEPSQKKRIRMARRALEISKDCADAYVLLAEETADSLQEEKALYEAGVLAGENALGARTFQEKAGHFWSALETRPYMRARAGLAGCLWYLGRREAAISHYFDMIRLNPDDNQGLRYPLLNHLLEEGRDREARELLDRYPEDPSAHWRFSKALLKFKREGSNSKTDSRLRKALVYNRFVPPYLLGLRKLPKKLPEGVGFGDEAEAMEYVGAALRIWHQTDGAIEWLAAVTRETAFPDEA